MEGKKMTLKEARKAAGLRQVDVAKALGTTTTTLVRWEHGISEMKVSTFFRLCEMYNCQPTDIIFGKEVKMFVTK